jgi:hypothetical protein
MQFRLLEVAFAAAPARTRIPFRFGRVTVAEAPILHVRAALERVDGARAIGMAADLLVPRWFRKDLDREPAADQAALRASAEASARIMLQPDAGHRTVFELWWRAYQASLAGRADGAPELLEVGFGLALLERAVIDAACRIAQKSFWSALQQDLFGFRPGLAHPELAGWRLPAGLPDRPRASIAVRHTVGMLDPLRTADAAAEVPDGQPRSLEEELRTRRLRWLKIKIGAGLARDRARLLAIAALCRDLGTAPRFTLDGNEQFASLGDLAELLDAVAAEPAGRELLGRLQFVEQPLPRAASCATAAMRDLPRIAAFAPLLLDEADDSLAAFPRALAAGWRGCSVKNCKGVFRALLNFGLARAHGDGAFLSAEDLTNLPVLALQQDLATVQALGLDHAERNGHHYFRGLDHLPAAVAAAVLAGHPDLYAPLAARSGAGAALRIEDGELQCLSLLGRGYGCDSDLHALLARSLPFEPFVPDA